MPNRIFDAASNFLEATSTFCEVLQKLSKIAETKINAIEKVTEIECEAAEEIALINARIKLIESRRKAANSELLKEHVNSNDESEVNATG